MEGVPPALVVPTGYTNATTAFFYPRPEITNIVSTLTQVYVSPQGSDDVTNVGANTSPFATISAALFYVTNVLDQPLTTAVCIFVAPGTYEGGFTVPDKVYLIGPSNSPEPVIITGNVFALSATSDSTIGLQNITFQGVTVAGAFYDVNLEMSNCKIQTDTVFSALTIAQDDPVVNASVYATECMFVATDAANVAVISGNTSEKTSLILDNCQLVTAGAEGSLIDMTGSLTVRNCSLLNTAAGTTLAPLIIAQSGATLTPVVSLEGSVLKYNDLQADTGGDKLAIRFNAPTQPITAKMTNCTLSIFLGAPNTDIVKNIGAQNVTMSQSANSCLKDGITIDTTNMVLTSAFFLQGSPLAPPPSAGVTFLNTLEGSVTITGASGVSVGSAPGNTITISGSGVASLAGLTGTVTLSSPDASITIGATGNDIELTANIPVPPVDSVGGKTGDITFEAGDGIAITYGVDNAAPINIANTGVLDISGVSGAVTLSGTNVAITAAGQNIDFAVSFPTPPVDSVGGKTGDITFEAGDGIAITYGVDNAAPINIANSGVLSVVAGTGITLTGDTPQNPTINVNLPVYQATYYKSADQTLNGPNAPGNTDITFDLTGSWNNTGGYITHVNGTTSFTVVQTGIYFLEFNANVNGAGVAWTGSKQVNIDITRSPIAEQAVIQQSATQNSGTDYGQSVSTTYYLVAGDVINLRIFNIYTSVTQPLARGLSSTFDLNTFFSWRYISSGGASAYQNPPPVIQAAGTTALVPTSANTTYILTSGAGAQNFTTAGLGAGNAGLVWYIKNSKAGDNTIQHNGVAITGVTSVLHERTLVNNTSTQILYWNGTDLIMY